MTVQALVGSKQDGGQNDTAMKPVNKGGEAEVIPTDYFLLFFWNGS